MGNSGSVNQIQPSLKDLHSYYQVRSNPGGIADLGFLNVEQKKILIEDCNYMDCEKPLQHPTILRKLSSTKTANLKAGTETSTKCTQVKVLPNLTHHLRLRSTKNGAILHSGGTISGRKDSLLQQPMVRSNTFIHEKSIEGVRKDGRMSPKIMQRSQTQLRIDTKRNLMSNFVTPVPLQKNCIYYKASDAALDMEPSASMSNSSETNHKLSKVKLKNKKRKAPPVPHTTMTCRQSQQSQDTIAQEPLTINNTDFDRRQRIFKTKSNKTSQTKQIIIEQKPPVKLGECITIKRSSKDCLIQSSLLEAKEKSLENSVLLPRKISTNHQDLSVAPTLLFNSNEKDTKTGFKVELEAATKSQLNSSIKRTSKLLSMLKKVDTQQRDSNTCLFQRTTPQETMRTGTQSKIPQLKKTFYFGMDDIKRKQGYSSQKIFATSVKPAVSTSDKSEINCDSSGINIYNVGKKYGNEVNDNGIQVNVRPTLPRRQLEIPRFSPTAAWRTLTEQYRKQSLVVTESYHTSSSALQAGNTILLEDRISQIYREPCLLYHDNKSGDSGISGDEAYLPEKPIQPRNLIHIQAEYNEHPEIGKLEKSPMDESSQPFKVVGPFLSPWTPQQDLDEEDSSFNGEPDAEVIEPRNQTSAHVFSLSLPRDTNISLYGEKRKPEFRSLQKQKRYTSTDFNTSIFECTESSDSNVCKNSCFGNYRSDNWLLSKTCTVAIATDQPLNHEQTVLKNTTMDWSAFIQPVSIGCLVTGKHLMYLPNRPMDEFKRQSVEIPQPSYENNNSLGDASARACNNRFSFQSSMRQIERRRLDEKLSKDVEQKEALRKSELEVMRRVEEEFKKKRAYEKATIRHQLRLYSMDDDNFSSLPYIANTYRAEPDGAVSSTYESPKTGYSHNERHRGGSSDMSVKIANP